MRTRIRRLAVAALIAAGIVSASAPAVTGVSANTWGAKPHHAIATTWGKHSASQNTWG